MAANDPWKTVVPSMIRHLVKRAYMSHRAADSYWYRAISQCFIKLRALRRNVEVLGHNVELNGSQF